MSMQLVKVGIVAALAMGFGGCSSKTPIISNSKVIGHESLFTQQEWALAQADEALAVLGEIGQWYKYDPELQWPRDKQKIIDAADTLICASGPISERPGEL